MLLSPNTSRSKLVAPYLPAYFSRSSPKYGCANKVALLPVLMTWTLAPPSTSRTGKCCSTLLSYNLEPTALNADASVSCVVLSEGTQLDSELNSKCKGVPSTSPIGRPSLVNSTSPST